MTAEMTIIKSEMMHNGKVQLNENKDVKQEIIGLLLDKMSCM